LFDGQEKKQIYVGGYSWHYKNNLHKPLTVLCFHYCQYSLQLSEHKVTDPLFMKSCQQFGNDDEVSNLVMQTIKWSYLCRTKSTYVP